MNSSSFNFAYADPPYLGCCGKYDHYHPDGRCWNEPETHRALIGRLVDEYPGGWAMSLSSPSLRTLLPMCPPDVREAFAEAIQLVMKEARKGEHAAPARQRITYTGGLRRAANLLDTKLGEAMEAERDARVQP